MPARASQHSGGKAHLIDGNLDSWKGLPKSLLTGDAASMRINARKVL
ncbi:MAG: hypothetical protein M3P45_15080 [Acidobacteriota bacterium]|nr:hypothetical protein [Acidobacteriota bacterium]